MKKLILSFFLLLVATILSAQEVKHNKKVYKVQDLKMYVQNQEVTAEITKNEKEQRAIDKKQRKAKKSQKKAEKKQNKAERDLKKHEQAQKKYLKTEREYKKTIKKHEKLKRKGKLSLQAEQGWLEKIDKEKSKLEKAKKKL